MGERKNLVSMVQDHFKDLGRCAAVHAEENAILNVARLGSAVGLGEATLFTTTYPCNLCANKIVQVGLGKVVYAEPYPDRDAKRILDDAHVEQEAFDGVSYAGYFRLLGGAAG